MKSVTFVLAALLCGLLHVGAELNIFPENDAVIAGIGTTVLLRCGSSVGDPAARILWTEFASTPLGLVISDNRQLVPSHPNAARYAIIGSVENHEFFLEIRDVQLGDGGTYLCQDVNGSPPAVFRAFAELVVLETQPQCSDYATGSGIVIDGSLYSAECEVNFKGNLVPKFEWAGPPGHYIQNGTTSTTRVWSYMYFSANREIDAQVFLHRTYFEDFDAEPGYAGNTPEYTHTHFGPPLDVSWPPNVITASPIKPFYEVGDVILCSPDSKPPSQVQWQNMRTLVTHPVGATFIVTADLLGFDQVMRCNALVLIEGGLYSNDLFINVSVPLPTTTPEPTTPAPTTPAPADGPCHDLSGRWTASNPPATICLEVDSRGNVFGIIRNGTDLFFVPGQGKTVINDFKHFGFTAQWPAPSGVGGFVGECHNCYGTEVIMMSGLARNKFDGDTCGASTGTQLTNLYVFQRSGPICVGMEVDEIRTNHKWIVDKMGITAKKISPL